MAIELPYLPTYKNVSVLFDRIMSAKIPDAFNHGFLQTAIGLKASGDRQLISLLRSLGFVDTSGKPTANYSALKNSTLAKKAIANGIRTAYKPLFDANEDAHKLPMEELKALISQVAGTEDMMTAKIAGTFSALTKVADFSGVPTVVIPPGSGSKKDDQLKGKTNEDHDLRTEFHYNIQVHLPSNATEETYLNIFNAIRKVFK